MYLDKRLFILIMGVFLFFNAALFLRAVRKEQNQTALFLREVQKEQNQTVLFLRELQKESFNKPTPEPAPTQQKISPPQPALQPQEKSPQLSQPQQKTEIKNEPLPAEPAQAPQKTEIKNEPTPQPALTQQKEGSIQEDLQFQEKPDLRGYTYNLKRLLELAQENIRRVDEEIIQTEVRKRNEGREARIKESFEKGNQLYQGGKLREAKKEWENAVAISKDPEMKSYIRESDKQARLKEAQEKKAAKEKSRLEKIAAYKQEQARLKEAKQEKKREEVMERVIGRLEKARLKETKEQARQEDSQI